MKKIQITNLEDPRLDVYTKFNECQLLHYFEPNGGLFICETPTVIERALVLGCEPLSYLVEEKAFESEVFQNLIKNADEELEIFVASNETINKLTGFNLTRGVLSAMVRPKRNEPLEILKGCKRVAVLEDVQNPTNLGAIFRSAAALGVEAVFVTADSTDPFYRRAARVSMGTVFQVPWAYLPKDCDICAFFKGQGFKTVSMALKEDAISISELGRKNEEKLAIILGTEGTGIKDETIDASDYKVIIPMYRDVDSLNVAAASAVAFYELCSEK